MLICSGIISFLLLFKIFLIIKYGVGDENVEVPSVSRVLLREKGQDQQQQVCTCKTNVSRWFVMVERQRVPCSKDEQHVICTSKSKWTTVCSSKETTHVIFTAVKLRSLFFCDVAAHDSSNGTKHPMIQYLMSVSWFPYSKVGDRDLDLDNQLFSFHAILYPKFPNFTDTMEKKCLVLYLYFLFWPLLNTVCFHLICLSYMKVLTDSNRCTGFLTPSKSPVLLLTITVSLYESCKICNMNIMNK
jgi:hypothetical protein